MFLPLHCVVCRATGSALCARCAVTLRPPPEPPPLPGLDHVVALFAYEGAGRAVVAALKFRNHRDALGELASTLAWTVAGLGVEADVVTWVPTSAPRRRARGYDQAELLARAVAGSLQMPARSTVRRLDPGHQTGRHRDERLAASRFSPRFESFRRPSDPVVLVVDDVRTTGASLASTALALRSMGADAVVGATLAATSRSALIPEVDPLQSGSQRHSLAVPEAGRGEQEATCRST